MKKISILNIILGIIVILLSFNIGVVKVQADTGPKPETEITILNLKKSDYIVALATKYKTYLGPHHSFVPQNDEFGYTNYGDIEDLTLIYNNVVLEEGWYLLDVSKLYKDTSDLYISSGYYWPSEFILILYDEVNDQYYLSEEVHTYAFHSYFTFDMNNYEGSSSLEKRIALEKSYDYSKEIIEFFIRFFLTILIEIGLAFVFKFDKKSLLIILLVNIITQVGLNISLNITAFNNGKQVLYVIVYALIEVLIAITEAIIYKIFCRRGKEKGKKWIICYALLANILSFCLGMILWFLI